MLYEKNLKTFFSILIFVTTLFYSSVQAVVILIHGTFANDSAWCKPGGDFYEAISKKAALLGHNVVPFTWSGKLKESARIKAAESLVKLIVSYPKNEQIIVIGHSHGGNVINFASRLLYDPLEEIMESFWQEGGVDSISDFIDEIVPSLQQAMEFVKTDTRLVQIRSTKKYIIDMVFLLATPVDTNNYAPNMNVIGNVYNLYSCGDYVQPVLGMYKRTYPKQEHLWNVRVEITGSGIFGGDDPTHEHMHHPALAAYLLTVPAVVENRILVQK